MKRDLTDKQLRAALERHGFAIEGRHIADGILIARHPEIPGCTGFFSGDGNNRMRLAAFLRRLDIARAEAERSAKIKAAWDAEFSQPIEPRFAADSSDLGECLAALRAILFQVAQGKILERDACIRQAREIFAKAAGQWPAEVTAAEFLDHRGGLALPKGD